MSAPFRPLPPASRLAPLFISNTSDEKTTDIGSPSRRKTSDGATREGILVILESSVRIIKPLDQE